jgi:hypothetical protein
MFKKKQASEDHILMEMFAKYRAKKTKKKGEISHRSLIERSL